MNSSVRFKLSVVLVLLSGGVYAFQGPAMTEAEIKQRIIQQSISSYPGNCPCPYSVARNGSSCGRRSAYSKPGGYAPLCYPADVTPEMVHQYKRKNNIQ